MAMASAAALELRPLCPTEGLGARELCWMTGAGEPVGSEVSFILSSAAATEQREGGGEGSTRCKLRGTLSTNGKEKEKVDFAALVNKRATVRKKTPQSPP